MSSDTKNVGAVLVRVDVRDQNCQQRRGLTSSAPATAPCSLVARRVHPFGQGALASNVAEVAVLDDRPVDIGVAALARRRSRGRNATRALLLILRWPGAILGRLSHARDDISAAAESGCSGLTPRRPLLTESAPLQALEFGDRDAARREAGHLVRAESPVREPCVYRLTRDLEKARGGGRRQRAELVGLAHASSGHEQSLRLLDGFCLEA